MIKVKFYYTRGFNDTVEEIAEFEDGTSDEEIDAEFTCWVWEFIGDSVSWNKVDE